MRKTSKILVLVLALAMMFTMASMFTTSAATPEKLYLTPNANWKQDNARFAAYFFGNGETWVSMTDPDGDGIYEVVVPTGYPNVIFCRMNPGTTANNWNNKWNQTADLVIPTDGPNHFTVKEGTWDSGGGTWSTYGSTCLHTNLGEEATCTTPQVCLDCGDPVVSALGHAYNTAHLCTRCNEQAPFTVAGSGAHMNGEWAPTNTANDMTYADGVYTKVYENVAAGSYELKVVRDHDWGTAYPSANKAYTVATTGSTVTVTLKGTTVDIKVEAPHVNTLAVGDTNKIVIGDTAVDNGFGYLVESVFFTVEEKAHYEFVGEGLTILVYDLEGNNVCGFTGKADLDVGTYLVCIAANTTGTKGEFNVAVTKSEIVVPEHENKLVIGETNKIVVDGSVVNQNNNPIAWVPFVVEEKAHYAMTSEDTTALMYIFDTSYNLLCGATGAAVLEPGTYLVCVGNAQVGDIYVTVTKTEISAECEHVYVYMNCSLCGAANPYFEHNLMATGVNKVICNEYHLVDETGHGNPYQFTLFTIEEDGLYRFTSDKLVGFTIFTTEVNTEGADWTAGTGASWGQYIAGNEAELKAGTYYIGLIFVDGVGEYEITIEKIVHEHEFVDGECACGEKDPNWEPPVEDPVDPQPPVDEEPKDEVKEEEKELNFFEKILAWFMDLINKFLAIFKK